MVSALEPIHGAAPQKSPQMCHPHFFLLPGGTGGSEEGLSVDSKAPPRSAWPPTPCSAMSKSCPRFACALVQEAASPSCVWDGKVWWCAEPQKPRWCLREPVHSLTQLTSRLGPVWLQACLLLSQKVSGLHVGLTFCVQENTVWREFASGALCGECSWTAPHTPWTRQQCWYKGRPKKLFGWFWRLLLSWYKEEATLPLLQQSSS